MPKKFFSAPSFARCVFLSSVSMLLFCLGFFVSPLGIAALIVSPAPVALLGVRENKLWMALGILSASLALGVALDWGFALSYFLGYGLLGFALTLPLSRFEKGSECLLLCAAASVVSKVLLVAVSVALRGVNPFEIDLNALNEMLSGVYAGMAGGGQDAAELKESLAQAVAIVPQMLPFFIIVYSMFDSFLNYKLCEILQRKREVKFPPLPSFGQWRFPSSILHVLVFAFALPFFTDGSEWRLWTTLEYNLKFIVNVFFFLQGLALVWWWSERPALGRFFPLFLRVALVGFLSLPFMNAWITALGVGDMCIDFRNMKIKRA